MAHFGAAMLGEGLSYSESNMFKSSLKLFHLRTFYFNVSKFVKYVEFGIIYRIAFHKYALAECGMREHVWVG